jgi:hypothetical protein
MKKSQSPLDAQRSLVEQLASEGKSNSHILIELAALGVNTSDRSLRRAFRRWGIDRNGETTPDGVQVDGDTAEVTNSNVSLKDTDLETVLRNRGIDPDEWQVPGFTVNEWDGPGPEGQVQSYQQLKIQCTRKRPESLLEAARVPGDYIAPKKFKTSDSERLVVFVGDQQAPFHDRKLHSAFLAFLEDQEPHLGVSMGDTVDFPDISRHRLDPENTASVQECVNSGYALLRDYVQASEETEWVKIPGNHDERIRNFMIDNAMEFYGLKRAELEGQKESSVFSVEHLLRLDELGVNFLEPEGSYEHVQYNVSPYLAARHGWIARKGSGASALATLGHLGYSVVVGHTHRQSRVHKTDHDIDGKPSTLTAVETGCMCRIEGGLSYAVAPDWQNGFATATIWPDGKFNLDLGTFVGDVLVWRNKRYE